ncbi:MAG: trimethylamine methyltransferase family protein [Desulfohalobiaceae bacterium]|nr:trimethylamine methyltransferase family protein [Desulfohalobiaceae bacterium]
MKRNQHAGLNLRAGLSLNILSEDELAEIHDGTLEILAQTGLFVEDAEALELFGDHGADVDLQKKIVRIPEYLVEEAIRSAPSRVILAGRDPKHDLSLSGNRVYFTNFSEGVQVVDPYTGESRSPLKSDLSQSTRVIDALDEIDFCEKALGAHDVSQETAPVHNAEAILPYTSKHCAFGPGNGRLLQKIVQMGAAIAGGMQELKKRPLLSFTTCPVSPLKLIRECCEIIMESARSGLVCNILSMAMAGGTAPVSLAGTLVTHNAEILGGLTLSQLARKGAPVIYGSSTTAMDLKLASASVGTPECALISGAVARLARYYSLPSYVAGG